MKLNCEFCGNAFERPKKQINQSRRRGQRSFCGLACARNFRRKPENEKFDRKEYQKKYRANRKDYLRSLHQKKYSRRYKGFSECFIALRELENQIAAMSTREEIKAYNQTNHKKDRRRLHYEYFNCNKPEIGTVGNLEQIALRGN